MEVRQGAWRRPFVQTTREIALSSPASPIPEHRRNGPVSRPHVDGAGPTVASIARFEDCGALLGVFLIALPRRNMEEELIAVVGSQKIRIHAAGCTTCFWL